MFINFPKERTQAVTPTINYHFVNKFFALELSEQMTFSVYWDGGGKGTGWLSESYYTSDSFLHIGKQSLWASGLCPGKN